MMNSEQKHTDFSLYTFEEFLQNDFFISSVKYPTEEIQEFWDRFEKSTPSNIDDYFAAREYIETISTSEGDLLSDQELGELWADIQTTNIKNDVLEWNTTIGFSFNKNEIKHLYYEYENVLNAQGEVIGTKERDDISNKWFIGQPIGAIWDYKVTGIWQKDEVEEAAKYGQRPGDPKVWNNPDNDKVNADGSVTIVYDNDDKQFLGQSSPKVNWSMRNEFTFFKDLTFSFNIYSKMGHKSLETDYLNKDNAGSKVTNGQNVYAKKGYWTVDNPTNEYGRLDAQGPSGVTTPGKLHNRSFIRLDNISLAYKLPKKFISRWSIEKAIISGSIKNVAVWAKDWKYWDPETGGLAPRTFNIGLTLTL